jgi:hypothetical protein
MSAMSKKKDVSPASTVAALAADGDVADALAAAVVAAAAAADASKQDQPATDGPGSKRNSFSNPLDLLAGAASEHHEKEETGNSSAAQEKAAPAAAPATEKKAKRKLLLPVKPVGAKVADDFKVIHSAVTDVPAASSQSFAITNTDVLSGRGGMTNHHPGNILFRNLVKAKQADYVRASKHEKAFIAKDIVSIMRRLDPPGRFLKKDPKDPERWVEVGDKKAREKASQALREGAPKVRFQLGATSPTQHQQQGAGVKASQRPDLRNDVAPPIRGAAVAPVPDSGAAQGSVSLPVMALAAANTFTPPTGSISGPKRAQAPVPSSEGEPKKIKAV